MDFWTWLYSTTSVDVIVQALGLAALAILFASDRIMTKGQHDRRIADLVHYHELAIVAKDERNAETREARDILRAAVEVERTRADKATDTLRAVGDYANLTNRLLEAIDDVMGNEKP